MRLRKSVNRNWVLVLAVMVALLAPAGAWAQAAPGTAQMSSAQAKDAAGPQVKPGEQQKPPVRDPAKEPEQPPPPTIEVEVVVTAPRIDIPLKDTPAATSVVSDITLKTQPRGVGAEETLQSVPGLKVDNQADGERVHVSIRGQGLLTERGIRGVTALLDGIPLNDPSGFVPDLFDVDWNNVGRIEVFRGVASALYGGASAGGIINLSTRDGGAGGPTGDVSLAGGSYGFWKGTATVGGTAGSVNYRVSASANRGDAYRLHAAFDAMNLYGKARWKVSDTTELTAIVAGTRYFNENPEGLNLAWTDLGQGVPWARQANPDSLTFNEYQRTRRFTTGLTGKTRFGANQDLSFVVFVRRTGWTESVPSFVQHRTYTNPGGNLQYTLNSARGALKNHLTLGTDMSWQAIDDTKVPNLGQAVEGTDLLADQTIDQRGLGFYAIDRIEFNPQWGAMLSVRADRIRNELTDALKAGNVDLSGQASFSKPTGRVGVAYNPRPEVGLYASWGQGFLPPATEELGNNPDRLGGFNTHLTSATSQGEEFGVRGGKSGFSYDVGVFHLTTDDDFGRYRVANRPLETFYGNVGTSRRYGLETAIGYYPNTSLALRAAYTYSDFLYTNVQFLLDHFTDKVMPNAPRHQLAFDAEYSVGLHWVIGVNAFGQSMQYVDHRNQMTADGFALVNPRVGYRWKGSRTTSEVMLQGRNVFGTDYIAFTEPDPDGNSFQPGPTRELFLGVRLGFGRN
jgi:iron complex outermembrane receptor protein